MFASLDKLDAPDDLSLLCELNWRLEKTLNPLWVEQVQNASAIVEKYNPFPHILELHNCPQFVQTAQNRHHWIGLPLQTSGLISAFY